MSTEPVATDKVTTAVNQITAEIVTYAPSVIAGVQAAEQAVAAAGADKKAAVVNSIIAVSKVGEHATIPQVAAISGLVDLVVSIFNMLGIFNHTAPTP